MTKMRVSLSPDPCFSTELKKRKKERKEKNFETLQLESPQQGIIQLLAYYMYFEHTYLSVHMILNTSTNEI